jgi:uncharacterized protein (TIGR03067 family)
MFGTTIAAIAAFVISGAQCAIKIKSELEKLEGEWACTSIKSAGKVVSRDGNGLRMTIQGDRWNVKSSGEERIRVDPTRSPKHIDRFREPPPSGTDYPPGSKFGPGARGIYQLDGDKLTICQTLGSNRPKGFDATEEGESVLIWKRVKK